VHPVLTERDVIKTTVLSTHVQNKVLPLVAPAAAAVVVVVVGVVVVAGVVPELEQFTLLGP
jgi:hypothetical protein